jgi:predicted permease
LLEPPEESEASGLSSLLGDDTKSPLFDTPAAVEPSEVTVVYEAAGNGKESRLLTPTTPKSKKHLCSKVLTQLLQPPVIASLAGLVVACIPSIHGLLVDTEDFDDNAPLQWLFNALYDVGQAAIPINMFMLGATLATGIKAIPADFRWAPNLAVAFGKLVIMPAIGTMSVYFLHEIIPVKASIAPSLFFAMLIVTCSPTANNINVMAEIGGVNKDTMALCILTQYLFAPFALTFWVFVFNYIVKDF